MKKIVVITTGGTIAMKTDPVSGGLVPAVSGADLMAAVPALSRVADIEVAEYSNVPSGHITPSMMLELAHCIDTKAAADDVAGIVVTHGTDTLEETAFLLDLTLRTEKPVCVTGAMRGASDTSGDGPGNILAAVQTAVAASAAGRGVLVVLNNIVHAARDVTKTHAVNTDTFASPWWGPVGYVYEDTVVFRRQPQRQLKIRPQHLDDDVYLLKCAAGDDGFLLRCLIEKKVHGIVVEAFGCGNVPPAVKKEIEAARQAGIPVVLATRVQAGRVVPVYSYEGSAGSMLGSGIFLAGELTGPKARLKLMLALGVTRSEAELQGYFTD